MRGLAVLLQGALVGLLLAQSPGGAPAGGAGARPTVPAALALPAEGPAVVPQPLSPAAEAALVERQRASAQEASRAVGHRVALLEDEHFIFLSDLPAGARRQVMGWLGGLYRNLDRIFAAGRQRMRLWDGKLVVAVFLRRADYLKFALKLQGQEGAIFAGGYFQPQMEPASGAMTASVVVPMPESGKESLARLRSVLVHEVTHAFLYYWLRPGRTPLWLHEGTAVHMQAVADPKDPEVRSLRRLAKGLARGGGGYPVVLAAEGVMPQGGADTAGYAQALAMTETLLAASTPRYVTFIRLMKEGTAQKEALARTFGWSYDALDAYWRRYVRKEY